MTASLKQVYLTSVSPDDQGNYFKTAQFDPSIEIEYPFTAIEIPDDLKDKKPKFDWHQGKWIDSGVDPMQAQITELQLQNTALSKNLKQSTADLMTATDAITQLTVQVAKLTVGKAVE